MNAVLRPAQPWHRPMAVADLDAVMAVEAACYSFPWSRGNFIDSLAAGYRAELRLGGHGELLGYSMAMPGFEEMHLLNLSVAPRHQRQGHAQALVARLADDARRRGDHKLWLEVRVGNEAAIALYRRLGFAQVGVRKGYYPAAIGRREDALVMSLALAAGEGDA